MKQTIQNKFLVILGWFFIGLAVIGVVLPILPTTPFLILALTIFAKSSPRFHQMLLNNKMFGAVLKQWEEKKTVPRGIKLKAAMLVLASFSFSVYLLKSKIILQIMLIVIAVILLLFIWQLKER